MNTHEHDLAEINRIVAEQGLDDTLLLGSIVHPEDMQADWLTASAYYKFYHAIGTYLKPKRIGEIGTRRGYSLKAMMLGAMAGGVPFGDLDVFSYDNECYCKGSMQYVWDNFRAAMPGLRYYGRIVNSQSISDLEVNMFDCFHVDGDHSYDGTYHDIELAFNAMAPGGVILVDDVTAGCSTVTPASADFCAAHGLEPLHIPHYRGLHFIRTR